MSGGVFGGPGDQAMIFLIVGLMFIMVMSIQWAFYKVTSWIAKKLEKK
jgi:hypothetical protein